MGKDAGRTLPTVRILGVPVHVVTMAETIELLRHFVESGQPHFVITADASGVVQAQTDAYHRSLFDRADLVTPDSAGILWASKRAGQPIQERVSGVDLVERACQLSATHGYRIFFLGAAPGVAAAAAAAMREKYPGCQIVGARDGYFKPDEDARVAAEIAATDPDFLFVAMGIPRQEKFILGTQEIIRARVAMGVGGSFDVHSGSVRRAPRWMQRARLEWLWRLLQNPSKIGKTMLLPKFVRMVLTEKR